MCYENKEFKEGIELINDWMKGKCADNIVLNWYLGMHYQKLGRKEKAIEYLK